MKVIGAGLPRTATTTQMLAMERLGLAPCYHMRDLLGDLERGLPLWEAAADGNPDWERIFGDAQSTCDWPSAYFYRELAEHYPDAKVVLTVRSGEGWVKSMRETVWAMFAPGRLMYHLNESRAAVDALWRRYLDLMYRFNLDPQSGAFGPLEDTLDDARFAGKMERWNDEVRSTIAPGRLLVWDPAEGWEPLCEFLALPVPDEPLPRTNDTSAFKEGIIGGAVAAIDAWWEQRERPQESLHGASAD